MRLPRFYYDQELKSNRKIVLDERNVHYAIHVLRLQKGHTICLFNGDGYNYLGSIVDINKKHVTIHITTVEICSNESPLSIELAQGIARGEKMDFIIQKAVEL